MAKQTKEVAVIDFEKFSVAQLPELQGKKEEIKGIIEANPVVEIVDNSTYELAKKSRTAIKSLCTGLEGEQKTVKKRIKEFVLDPVDKEYDTLVLGARSALKERQEPITAWEDKKEQERLEKARLEELRVKQIKEAIQTFKDAWIDNVNHLLFEGIAGFNEMFEAYSAKFDRSQLAEFEVLFDDALLVIRQLADSKIKTLTEQEQIRVDNLLIEEKKAESKTIQSWQSEWRTNIDSLKFDDVKDVNSVLVKSKLVGLKHYSTEYGEIFTSTEKRLHSQIELVSKAEEQRIAQEKFQKEKAEFEEKQLEAKYQERCKQLVDLGFVKHTEPQEYYDGFELNIISSQIRDKDELSWDVFFNSIINHVESEKRKDDRILELKNIGFKREFDSFVLKSKTITLDQIKNYSDEKWIENTTQEVDFEEVKTDEIAQAIEDKMTEDRNAPIPTEVKGIFTNEIVQEQFREFDEEEVHEVATTKPHKFANYKEEVKYIEQVETKREVTWESVIDDFKETKLFSHEDSGVYVLTFFCQYLTEKGFLPTKKQ